MLTSVTAPPPPESDRAFDYLPVDMEPTSPRPSSSDPVSPVTYDIVGTLGGVVIGGLLTYLMGALG